MKLKKRYELNKSLKVGDSCVCPSCATVFIKTQHQQAFCKSKGGTICKDKYWNTVTPTKRCNTTRISPASARYMGSKCDENFYGEYKGKRTSEGYKIYGTTAIDEWGEPVYEVDEYDDTHPFDGDNFNYA